jgi:phosphoheptose isomerase
MTTQAPLPTGLEHLLLLQETLAALEREAGRVEAWARRLAPVLSAGGRVLAAGNGGSAAQAQHLTAELVGRYRDERMPFSALAVHAEIPALTAIGNDYGLDQAFARQVSAHGRTGDVLVALSTSGRSRNVLAAVVEARRVGMTTWGLTGAAPNPIATACDDAISVPARSAATVQEGHLVLIHMICAALDCALGVSSAAESLGLST